MSWKRPLFLFHRWAGIVLCAVFALWFASGLFMMYVPFPQLSRSERLAGMQPLDFSTATLAPSEAVKRLQPHDFSPQSIRLAMLAGRPAYVVHADNGGRPRVVFADNGEVLREVTSRMGEQAASRFMKGAGKPEFRGIVHTDQWSVSGGLNHHRPLLLYALNDPARTVLYVSSVTGEVVRDTQRTERVLNYFGAVTHWIYPTFIRKHPLLWEWIVDILSGVGVVLAMTGLWIGVLRWNRRARPGKPQVPYKGLMRWHYFTGIVFGTVTVTWVFSGLLSMNPLNLNPSSRPLADQHLLFAGKRLTPEDFQLPARGFGAHAVEAELMHYAGHAFHKATDWDGATRMIAADAGREIFPDARSMIELAPGLIPNAQLVDAAVLTAYDNYYYSRYPDRDPRPLPALRVRFADSQHTWFHLNPLTGEVLERSTRANRVYRWLYNGLHSFDIWWLWQRRPLWDLVVIAFSLGGLLLSCIGVVIGWRRLRRSRFRNVDASTVPAG